MSTSGLSTPPERTPKQVPRTLVIIPWAVAGAIITGYAVRDPHDLTGAAWVLGFPFVGMGCATLCAWLVQRSAIAPYNDYLRYLDHAFDAGYRRRRRDERAAAPGLVIAPRFGGPGAYAADDAGDQQEIDVDEAQAGT